jgi:alkaline phosphatase
MGLFTPSHMSYEVDRGDEEPTLAQMTTAALEMLDGRGEGFILQVEGGRVDHGAHGNDAGAMLYDQLAFDDAIGAALGFIDGRDDTLLIITTDHGNANPGLTFYGEQGIRGFERLRQTRSSIGRMLADGRRRGGGADDPAPLGEAVLEATGVELSEQDLGFLTRAIDGQRVDPFMPANRPGLVLGALLANHTGVRFLSPNHTSDHVEVTATGPGAEMLAPALAINELHELVTKAMDLAPARPLG